MGCDGGGGVCAWVNRHGIDRAWSWTSYTLGHRKVAMALQHTLKLGAALVLAWRSGMALWHGSAVNGLSEGAVTS